MKEATQPLTAIYVEQPSKRPHVGDARIITTKEKVKMRIPILLTGAILCTLSLIGNNTGARGTLSSSNTSTPELFDSGSVTTQATRFSSAYTSAKTPNANLKARELADRGYAKGRS